MKRIKVSKKSKIVNFSDPQMMEFVKIGVVFRMDQKPFRVSKKIQNVKNSKKL